MANQEEEIYLRTDEYKEAVGALEMVAELLPTVLDDVYRWKWAIIALHNAVQGFMVLAIKGTKSLSTLREQHARKWLNHYRNGDDYPKRMDLDYFFELFIKTQQDELRQYVRSKKYTPCGTQICSVKQLNELRNEFIHFTPKGYSLEVHGLPLIFKDCLEIIEFLGWKGRNFFWHESALDEIGRNALQSSLAAVQVLIEKYGVEAAVADQEGLFT